MGQLTKFFLLTFFVTWSCFIPIAIQSRQAGPPYSLSVFQQALLLLGTFAPSLVAIWLSARSDRPGAVQTLLERIGKWQVNIRWYIVAGTYMAVIKLLVALTHRIIAGTWPVFGKEAWYIMMAALLISTWVQAGEEIGWRGFALPRMSEKLGLPAATLVLGLLWACWHLPLFFLRQADTFGQSFPMYALQVTAFSVAVGWLYWQTKGSLLLVMFMHAAVNNTKDIVPSATTGATDPFALSHSLVGWLTVALMWILASYFLVAMRGVRTFRF